MKTSEFKALQEEWYAKLAMSGFIDIERHEAGDKTRQYRFMNMGSGARAAKEDYFYRAFQMLNRHFDSPAQRKLWRMHANGAYNVSIAKAVGISQYAVRREIVKLQRRFGLTCLPSDK